MKAPCCVFWIIVPFLIVNTGIMRADDAKVKAIKEDRKRIEGSWRIVALEVNGKKANDKDARKLTVVNGPDGTWSLLSQEKEVAQGTSAFDPTKNPKTIDLTIIRGGGKGQVHLGIYELGDKVRRLCFAPPGKDRPSAFTTEPGSDHILVTFERESHTSNGSPIRLP